MTEADFVAALADAPDDLDRYRVYADWLEDHNDLRAGHVRQLVRIKELLPQVLTESASWRQFTLQPCLPEATLAVWEDTNGVPLPEPYRLFLRHIGNGAHLPSSYTDFVLFALAPTREEPLLREAFPITWEQHRQRLAWFQENGRTGRLFPELGPLWDDEEIPGCLSIGRYPSYDWLFLVITGELRGAVWSSAQLGAPEHQQNGQPHDFLTWFEELLLDPGMR